MIEEGNKNLKGKKLVEKVFLRRLNTPIKEKIDIPQPKKKIKKLKTLKTQEIFSRPEGVIFKNVVKKEKKKPKYTIKQRKNIQILL
jgi:hypothetical protein